MLMTSNQIKPKGKWLIRPIYSLVMMMGSVLCAILGFWQFSKSLTYHDLEHMDVPLIKIKGRYLADENWYLDNRTLNGVAGYEVMTPFVTGQKVWLVNRGFIAYENRSILPDVVTPLESAVITGLPSDVIKPLILKSQKEKPELSRRLQFVNIEDLNEQLSHRLSHDFQEQLFVLKEGSGQLSPMENVAPYMSRHKHLAYAVQWWLLMVAAIVIWLVSSYRKHEFK